jgi:pimeloyl-ACP methyl ester carboxylesterase
MAISRTPLAPETWEITMSKLTTIARFAGSAALSLLSASAFGETTSASAAAKQTAKAAPATDAPRTGRAAINGVDYYYEIRGKGEPLLLLHGGLGSSDMFGPVLTKLAEGRKVITVDLQGHGRTPLGNRAFKLESIGDDMAVLAERLGHAKLDVMGYSLGGGVALRMALQKPERVRRLVLVSTPFSDDGFYPGIRAQQVEVSAKALPMMKETPMYKSYIAIAPKPSEFPRLLDTLGEYMKKKYDWSSEIGKLKMPVMLVFGDGDMFRPEHEIKFYQLLGGGKQDAGWARETLSQNRLAILPDLTHYEIFASPRLATTVLPFLNGQSDAKSWAEQVARPSK